MGGDEMLHRPHTQNPRDPSHKARLIDLNPPTRRRGFLARHLTYANAVATMALVVAMGGTAFAGLQLTGGDIRNGTITGRDIRPGTLTGRHIKGGWIRLSDIRVADRRAMARASHGVRAVAGVSPGSPPSLDPLLTRGFEAVYRVDTGVYCLQPSSGVDGSRAPVTVSPDAAFGEPQITSAHVVGRDLGLCGLDQVAVVTIAVPIDGGGIDPDERLRCQNSLCRSNDVGFRVLLFN